MAHIALEGRCFVLSACQYAQEKDYPADHAVIDATQRDPDNVMIAGGSVIISPLGTTLAGPLLGGEGVLTADLDLEDVARGKFDLDVTGHYARPDSEYASFGKCLRKKSRVGVDLEEFLTVFELKVDKAPAVVSK